MLQLQTDLLRVDMQESYSLSYLIDIAGWICAFKRELYAFLFYCIAYCKVDYSRVILENFASYTNWKLSVIFHWSKTNLSNIKWNLSPPLLHCPMEFWIVAKDNSLFTCDNFKRESLLWYIFLRKMKITFFTTIVIFFFNFFNHFYFRFFFLSILHTIDFNFILPINNNEIIITNRIFHLSIFLISVK